MQASPSDSLRPFTLSSDARGFMRRMVRMSGLGSGAGFRLVVEPGGCSGLSSSFSIEAAPQEGDVVVADEDLVLFVPASCRPLLDGVIVDFADTATQTGLTFLDPKAQGCCST